MKLAQFKPTQYVDTYSDLPIEFMQGQLENAQKRYDIQRSALDKQVDLLKNVEYGELGKDIYGNLKSDYETLFKGMSDELGLTGDVSTISRKFSDAVRTMALDERFKELKKENEAYQKYQENILKNPGAINLLPYATEAGLQIGKDVPLSQALQYYQVTEPQNSFEDIENTFRSLKASQIDDNTWEFKDPLTQKVYRGGADVKGLSDKRLKETLDSYYNTWNVSGKSQHHKQKILQAAGLNPITDMGIFNTPKGKELYDKYAEFLMGYAYTEKDPAKQDESSGSKSKTGTKEEKEEIPFLPMTSTTYGYQNGNGYVTNADGSVTDIPLNSRPNYELQLDNYDKADEDLFLKLEYLESINAPLAERKAMADKIQENGRKRDIIAREQEKIEGDLYGYKPDPNALKNALIETLGNTPGFPEVNSSNYGVNYEYIEKGGEYYIKYINPTPAERFLGIKPGQEQKMTTNGTTGGKGSESVNSKISSTLEGKDAELFKRYDAYNSYLTSGKAYSITNSDDVKILTTFIQGYQNKNLKYKNVLTDKETNIDSFDSIIPKNEDGVPDYSRLSYEVLLDEIDGPVLVIHGVGENGSEGYEVPLENFGNVREFFGRLISPEEQAYMTKFTEASQSLKASKNKNEGSFNVNRFDGSANSISFSREKIGSGKYGYTVANSSDGTKDKMYGSMEEMIYGEILPYSMEDSVLKLNYDKMLQAVKSNDYNSASRYMNTINQIMIEKEKNKRDGSSGKQNPQTSSKGPLGLGR
jgi:hypothetical protein